MKTFYIFLFITFFIRTNSQIKENPIFLVEDSNIFVLSSKDDYYYGLTPKKSFKIKKESEVIENNKNNPFTISDYIYFVDNEYNNYLFKHISETFIFGQYSLVFKYYQIKYSSDISLKEMTFSIGPKKCGFKMKFVGAITRDNEFFIYGYSDGNKNLVFIRKSYGLCVFSQIKNIDNINEKLSCKLIEDRNIVCAMISEKFNK